MNLLSDNVIPGNYGKIFEVSAIKSIHLEKIKSAIFKINGVKDVLINKDTFLREITVHTSSLVKIEDIQKEVIKIGFHAIPKSLFPL